MKIHHQGWNDAIGAFNCDVTLDERRSDHEIHFPHGVIFRQATPFLQHELDWDQTGEPYPKLGAFFDCAGSLEFFTPLELASLALQGHGLIPGLIIEDRQSDLASRIQAAARRAAAIATIQGPTPDRNLAGPAF